MPASSRPAAPDKRPIRLGKFLVLARIASGGMGAVYKVFDTVRERELALKVLAPDLATRPVMLRHFQLEARHGQRLPPHEHVVTLFEAGAIQEFHYLALELIEGTDLKEYVACTGPLPVEESRTLLVQAAHALDHLHQHGITHRDIKPANFLLTRRQGRPILKLIDLGLAQHRDSAEEDPGRPPGSTLGTVDFLAPEQARNCAAADGRSDLYALGCTWYYLLSGVPPFGEGTPAERVRRHTAAPPPDIRQINPEVSPRLAGILQRLLAKNPADRYPTPAALMQDLQAGEPVSKPQSRSWLGALRRAMVPADGARASALT